MLNYSYKKRILVTGGAGFLGSNLIDRLVEENEVICLDNFFTGDKSNIRHLMDHENFELIRGDVCDPHDYEVTEIYNLACPASPIHYQYDPIKTLKTSVIGSLNLLELARNKNARILHASTSEVYGDPIMHPQKETYWGNVNPIGVRSCYDEGKRSAETLCFDFKRTYGVDVRVPRIFNTYGPRMHPNDGRVVSNFIVQALKNEDITIYGDGKQTRSFCYVDDLISGFIAYMGHCSKKNEEIAPINLGNSTEFTMIELAELVIELTNSKSKIIFMSAPEDDPKQRKPDLTKAKSILNWKPKIELREGIGRTIEYFESKVND